MTIVMADANGVQKSVQGVIPEEIASRFQAACKLHGMTQKEALGRIAELFVRLPQMQQAVLSIALRDDAAFTAFMQAVDRVVAEAILARLPSIGRIPEVDELRGRIAALEGTETPGKPQPGLRHAEGKSR